MNSSFSWIETQMAFYGVNWIQPSQFAYIITYTNTRLKGCVMYMSFARLAFANKLLRCLGLGTRDIERQKCLEFCTRLIKACQTGFCLILTLCSILFTHGFNNFVPICLSDCVHVFAACFLNSEVIDLIFVLLNPKLGFSWMPFSWKSLTDSN